MATILIKKRDTTGAPATGDLTNSTGGAEIAVNTFDKRLFSKDSGGTIVELGTNPSSITLGSDTISSFGTGVATALTQTVSGSGSIVLTTSPTLVTPVLGTPTSGQLSGCTVDGTDAVGFRNTPVNSQSADYTAVLADSGKTIFHPAADANDRTFTIPAESSVNYAVGTVVTFINLSANDLTIAITTDTMYLAGDGATGSRTLAEYGVASAVKVASTTWVVSGNGLS